jgi:hypothetical protein
MRKDPRGSNARKRRRATRLPAQDLQRARLYYAERLGLEPIEERPGGLRFNDSLRKTDENGIHEPADGRVAWFSDPEGNTFAIEERSAP